MLYLMLPVITNTNCHITSLINRPGVGGAVLQTASSLKLHYLFKSYSNFSEKNAFFSSGQSGEASWCRVCYQQGDGGVLVWFLREAIWRKNLLVWIFAKRQPPFFLNIVLHKIKFLKVLKPRQKKVPDHLWNPPPLSWKMCKLKQNSSLKWWFNIFQEAHMKYFKDSAYTSHP